MSNMIDFAKSELDKIGLTNDDITGEDMNYMMREHILRMVEEFDREGHSGFSANYSLAILKKLLAFKPLTPLTGEDDEWTEVYTENDGTLVYQNKRLSSVFKNEKTGAYNIDGIVFWSWFTDKETGEKFKSYYTSYESRVPVEFPYDIPDEPIYQYKESEEE